MKTIIKILLIGLFFALIALGLISCGARQVKKEQSKEETKTETVDNSVIEKQVYTNVKTTFEIKVDDKNESVTTETTYSPEDPTKEAYVIEKDGTKVILNNSKKTVKTETKKNNTQSELVNKTDELKNEVIHEQKAVKQVTVSKKENNSKEIDKKAFSPFNLLWLLIPALIIYIFYRIYKKLPLVPKF